MTTISARLLPGKTIDGDDFVDITPTPVDSITWGNDGSVNIAFAADLTAAEQAAIEDRIAARNPTEEALRQQARTALDGNRAFIGTTAGQLATGADAILASTSSSQQEKDLAKAVKALTNQTVALSRQNVKLIRLTLGMLDGLD